MDRGRHRALVEALDRAVKSGKVRSIGLSEWPVEKIVAAAESTAKHGWTPMASSQPQYSMLVRKPEAQVFAACREHGLGNIVFSPLAQGVLTGKYKPGQPPPADSRAANPNTNFTMETLVDTLESMRGIDLGIGAPMSFGMSEHQASHKIWGTIIDANGQYQPLDLE